MLSNTAVPKYYKEFRDLVLDGKWPISREVEMEMNRIDALIRDPNYYYDDQAVEGFIDFCENELVLTNGEPLKVLFIYKVMAEQLYGWYYFIDQSVYVPYEDDHGGRYVNKTLKKRLTVKQYGVLARGGAKSMYLYMIHAFELSKCQQSQSQTHTAPTMKQAEEVLMPFKTSLLKARGPLYKWFTMGSSLNTNVNKFERKKLVSTKRGIENTITNSLLEIKPMSIDKLQGSRARIATVDEWLSGDIKEDPISAIEQSASKAGEGEYIIIAMSSEGTVRNSVGDTMKLELMDILKGDYYAPHVSIWIFKLDNVSEVADPSLWRKANPNIGITVDYSVVQKDVERAEKSLAARNDILAKRFGIPLEGYTYFFRYEDTIPHRKQTFNGLPCALGIDLSQGDDFCAFSFLFPLRGSKFGVKNRCYITDKTLMKLDTAQRIKYEEFISEGSLMVMDGVVLDMDKVYDDLDNFAQQHNYEIYCVGYDPYNAKDFIDRYTKENAAFYVNKVIQGAKTESVPLGEIKNLAEDRMLMFDESIMMFTMGNAITIEDTNGNRKLLKKRGDRKIDCVAALIDAWVSFKLNKELFM